MNPSPCLLTRHSRNFNAWRFNSASIDILENNFRNIKFRKSFMYYKYKKTYLFSAECVRCYECRSDILRNCGDPFYDTGNVPAIECSQVTTKPTYMCFKTSQNVGGQYITVRGCAPFDSDTFGVQFQRQASGTYWKGQNSFSLCDYDNCNAAGKSSISVFSIGLAVALARL